MSDSPNFSEAAKFAKDGDVYNFINEFSMDLNSAIEIWGSEEQHQALMKLFLEGTYEFKASSSNEESEGLVDAGWTMFAEERNGDSYDAIFYKEKSQLPSAGQVESAQSLVSNALKRAGLSEEGDKGPFGREGMFGARRPDRNTPTSQDVDVPIELTLSFTCENGSCVDAAVVKRALIKFLNSSSTYNTLENVALEAAPEFEGAVIIRAQ